jgi:hypothetical protein
LFIVRAAYPQSKKHRQTVWEISALDFNRNFIDDPDFPSIWFSNVKPTYKLQNPSTDRDSAPYCGSNFVIFEGSVFSRT